MTRIAVFAALAALTMPVAAQTIGQLDLVIKDGYPDKGVHLDLHQYSGARVHPVHGYWMPSKEVTYGTCSSKRQHRNWMHCVLTHNNKTYNLIFAYDDGVGVGSGWGSWQDGPVKTMKYLRQNDRGWQVYVNRDTLGIIRECAFCWQTAEP